jgi:hypothetical protein
MEGQPQLERRDHLGADAAPVKSPEHPGDGVRLVRVEDVGTTGELRRVGIPVERLTIRDVQRCAQAAGEVEQIDRPE